MFIAGGGYVLIGKTAETLPTGEEDNEGALYARI